MVDDTHEKKWRNKKVKKSCAIPLRDASTPIMLASAYLDYLTLIVNVEGISDHINIPEYNTISNMLTFHKLELTRHYNSINRKVFSDDGFTMCPVRREKIKIEHVLSNNISDENSVQLGHVVPRSEEEFTIRGKNILMMSREGNRLVGDHRFDEDTWIIRLMNIVKHYHE